jgi:hypothetical protein
MDTTRAKTAISDSEIQASLLLTIGSLIWKWVSVAANVDFLLQINEERFAVIFDFLQNTGWWLLALGGFIWLIIRTTHLFRGKEPEQTAAVAPTWAGAQMRRF